MRNQTYTHRGQKDTTRRNLDLASLIANFRQQRGLSQEQLAQASRLSRTYIYHLEQGQRTHPSYQVVQRIARALELPATERQLLYNAYMQLTGKTVEGNLAEQTVGDYLCALVKRLF